MLSLSLSLSLPRHCSVFIDTEPRTGHLRSRAGLASRVDRTRALPERSKQHRQLALLLGARDAPRSSRFRRDAAAGPARAREAPARPAAVQAGDQERLARTRDRVAGQTGAARLGEAEETR
jgi:hypothetical protein